jgi:hypothetical protein
VKQVEPQLGWRPTLQQELLLRAALSEGDEALRAWQQWKRSSGVSRIDRGSARLLPLLYHNLRLHEVTEPFMERLKEEYVRTWCDNEILFHETARLLRSFQLRRIETIVLKGAALAALFYRDTGLRPMTDIDILVRPAEAGAAIRVLSEAGWRSVYQTPEALVPYEQAAEFRDGRGCRCDLHWRIFWDGRQGVGDDEFWDGAVSLEINRVASGALNPTDQLLHVCVHGAVWNEMPTVRWVADAAMILRTARSEINWGRLIEQVEKRRLMLPMADTLEYLQHLLHAPIPPDVLKAIRNIGTSRLERTLYQIRIGPNPALKRLPVLCYWFNAWRLSGDAPFQRKLSEYLRYLKCLWGVKYLRHLPFHLAWRIARGIAHIIVGLFPKGNGSPPNGRHATVRERLNGEG